VLSRFLVSHTHLGLQPQARERRAQVMRDAGQHHRAVLLDLGQLLGHAVEADVDFADLAGGYLLVKVAGVEVAAAHPAGGKGKLLQRLVDQPRDDGRAGQRQGCGHHQPDHPGLASQRADA
jgi:hypothetical protein